jgi:gas vesicle protein
MAQGDSSGEFVAGFLFGAFVGAVLALLFAPAPGEEVRDQLRERSIELRDRAEDLTGEARQQAGALRVKGQQVLEQQKTRFQEAIEEGKKAASRTKEELLVQLESGKPSRSLEDKV